MHQRNIVLIVLIFTAFITIVFFVYTNFINSKVRPISEYYEIIKKQESILGKEGLTKTENEALDKCYKENNFRCFVEYFAKFSFENPLEKTFSHLSYLMQSKPEYKIYCHQMAHGIGHGELRKHGGGEAALSKILQDFSINQYFKNIRSCGSGFFHGLLEEYVKGENNKEKLVETFKNICGKNEYLNVLKGDCIHGLGHASFLQLDYNIPDSLYVCDQVTTTVYDKFNCYTGVFMEANLDYPQNDLIVRQGEGTNANFIFPMCDKVGNELQRRACFFESVLQFRNFVKKDAVDPNKISYADMIPLCKNFNNELYRLICIRNISIRSVSENAEENLQKMCIDNTSTRAERVMCVAGFAHKIVMSITSEQRNQEYFNFTNEICNYLNKQERVLCKQIIKSHPSRLYIIDENSLNI